MAIAVKTGCAGTTTSRQCRRERGRHPAPHPGEQGRALLPEAGYGAAAIDDLIARGVVGETTA